MFRQDKQWPGAEEAKAGGRSQEGFGRKKGQEGCLANPVDECLQVLQ